MAEGKFRHFGISFHDRAEVLEQILTEYPQIEVVQIQFNYVDYDDPAVESHKCYEVCRKFGKPVIVTEPVKGGNLVNLPESAKVILDELQGGSPASYAIRFAAGFEGIMMVPSGMSDMAQMQDNISSMKDFPPLSDKELAAVNQVQEIFKSMNLIPSEHGLQFLLLRRPIHAAEYFPYDLAYGFIHPLCLIGCLAVAFTEPPALMVTGILDLVDRILRAVLINSHTLQHLHKRLRLILYEK